MLWNWPRRPHPVISSFRHSFVLLSFPLYPNIITSSHPCLVLTFSRPYPHVLFLVFAHPHLLPSSFSHRHILDRMSSHAFLPILIFSYPCVSHILTSSYSDPQIFSGVARGVFNPPSPEIPKAFQNRAKINPIVKTVKKLLNLGRQHTKMFGEKKPVKF